MQPKLITERIEAIATALETVLDDVKTLPTFLLAMDQEEASILANLFETKVISAFEEGEFKFDGSEADKEAFVSISDLEDLQSKFHFVAALERKLEVKDEGVGAWGVLRSFSEAARKMPYDGFEKTEAHYQQLTEVKASVERIATYRATVNPLAR